MSRPGNTRTLSTNLGGSGEQRVLEGKLGILSIRWINEIHSTNRSTGDGRVSRSVLLCSILTLCAKSSSGIGAAICENLASKGCSLVMNYTSDSSAEKTKRLAEQLETNHSVRCITVQADLGSENGPAHIVNTTLNHFAHPKTKRLQIDIVVNNAGVAGKTKIEDCTAEEFAWLYNVNVRGPLFLMKAAIPYLPTDRSGRVVNLSSVSASLGFHEDGMYGGTKAALEAMTRTWARELSERCTVNAVNPGPVATDMYAATSQEFQKKMAGWTRNTPLAAIRPGVDRKDLVDNSEIAGGRPVRTIFVHRMQ